jgi:hypothetical protein
VIYKGRGEYDQRGHTSSSEHSSADISRRRCAPSVVVEEIILLSQILKLRQAHQFTTHQLINPFRNLPHSFTTPTFRIISHSRLFSSHIQPSTPIIDARTRDTRNQRFNGTPPRNLARSPNSRKSADVVERTPPKEKKRLGWRSQGL